MIDISYTRFYGTGVTVERLCVRRVRLQWNTFSSSLVIPSQNDISLKTSGLAICISGYRTWHPQRHPNCFHGQVFHPMLTNVLKVISTLNILRKCEAHLCILLRHISKIYGHIIQLILLIASQPPGKNLGLKARHS